MHITLRGKKSIFEIKNNLMLISNINDALSPFLQHSNSSENNFILDSAMPVAADVLTLTDGGIMRENCFSSCEQK